MIGTRAQAGSREPPEVGRTHVEELELEGQVRQELLGLLNGQVGIVHGKHL